MMARTIEEIQNEITTEKQKNPVLEEIDTTSKFSVWGAIVYVVAFIIHTLEVLLDNFKTDVYKTIEQNRPGTLPWYAEVAKRFQVDSILNANLRYDLVDSNKQIIHYASVQENITGGITLKVAKKSNPLSVSELKQFTAYMERVKFAGVQISYESTSADIITVDLKVFYNSLANEAEVRESVNTATANYLSKIDFNGMFVTNDLIVYLRSLEEVRNVKVNQVNSTQGSSVVAVDVSHRATSGRFTYNQANSNIQLFSDSL